MSTEFGGRDVLDELARFADNGWHACTGCLALGIAHRGRRTGADGQHRCIPHDLLRFPRSDTRPTRRAAQHGGPTLFDHTTETPT